MKTYKVKYEKYEVAEKEFKATDKEQAEKFAEVNKPKGFTVSFVRETAKSILHPLFEDIANILKPEILSDCCGAVIHEDTDICSNCKEHC